MQSGEDILSRKRCFNSKLNVTYHDDFRLHDSDKFWVSVNCPPEVGVSSVLLTFFLLFSVPQKGKNNQPTKQMNKKKTKEFLVFIDMIKRIYLHE